MRNAAHLGAAIIAALLAGCAAGPPARPVPPPPSPAAQAAAADARQRLGAAEALCQQLAADPAIAALRERGLSLDSGAQWTRAMMVDTHYVDERDRALLLQMDERRARCRQARITASPDQAVPLLDYWGRQDAALIQLYNRQIPIGSYNRAMADAQAQFSIDIANQRSDNAVRANQRIASPPTMDAARRTGAAEAMSPDSFRALVR